MGKVSDVGKCLVKMCLYDLESGFSLERVIWGWGIALG